MNVALNSKSSSIKKDKKGKVLILANGPSINLSFKKAGRLNA